MLGGSLPLTLRLRFFIAPSTAFLFVFPRELVMRYFGPNRFALPRVVFSICLVAQASNVAGAADAPVTNSFAAPAVTSIPRGAGQYWKVDYPASTAAGELQVAVTYTIWIPDGVPSLRGIIV
ncbi:MAG TPA: hypothetical protein VG056_03980, partial [Pirellulales bacterium]|nr:hypothetical protein [Pirellulales bacterium]